MNDRLLLHAYMTLISVCEECHTTFEDEKNAAQDLGSYLRRLFAICTPDATAETLTAETALLLYREVFPSTTLWQAFITAYDLPQAGLFVALADSDNSYRRSMSLMEAVLHIDAVCDLRTQRSSEYNTLLTLKKKDQY